MPHTGSHTDEKFSSLLRGFDDGMLVTRAADGTLRARPMAVARLDDDDTVYFVTALDSAKVRELASNARVCVAFQNKDRVISLSGSAEVLADRKVVRELWRKAFELWFPDGPEDPNVIAVVVHPDEGEYWDQHGWNKLTFALRAARAFVKGERIEDDAYAHDHVKLS